MKNLFNLCMFLLLLITTKASSQYQVVHVEQTLTSLTLTLKYIGNQTYYLKPTSPIINNLLFKFKALTYSDCSLKIIDADKQRFEIPNIKPFPVDPQQNFSFPLSASSYEIQFTQNPFDFKIIRKSNKAILFSTYQRRIIFSDYYLQIGSQLQSQYLFGLGQRLSQGFKVKNGQWTMFNRDRGDEIDTGIGLQTYGYFPFYLIKQRENNFHIVYFQTSSALDAIKQQIQNKHFLTWKLIGGIINLRFFIADHSPQTALSKLHNFYGGSYLPPFWAMGYHQSRWGYRDITYLLNVTSNFYKYDIPLDTLWSDLDYMINSQVFTIDQDKFPLTQMKNLLQKYRWIPIIDPGIKNSGPIYQAGLEKNAYILDANTNQPILGKMRVGRTVYPDFFHPNASIYWKQMLQRLYSKVPFSGLWIDSNQFTSFCVGRCQSPLSPSNFNYNTDLPYSPGADDLEGDTISLNSTHYGSLIEADVHIYNGFLQTKASYQYLQSKGIQPFILTRSSILGSSQWSIHWSGDNEATYQFLRTSISDNLNSQLFGFQVTGADICGFGSDSNAQLCARWYQLGSIYPFCRNHNQRSAKDQQPYALGQPTLSAARQNIKLRYSLLKHFYSNLVKIEGKGGFWRPLFFEFATDPNVYSQKVLDTQFLIGEQLMSAPILQQSVTQRQVYFPQNNWFHYQSGKVFARGTSKLTNNKPNDLVPLFIRQGYSILVQDVALVKQTNDLDNRFIVVAGLKKDQKRANQTTNFYTAKAYTLAVANYNQHNDFDINLLCKMNFQLMISMDFKTLKIDFKTQRFSHAQEIVIFKVRLFILGEVIERNLQQQVKIKGTGQIQIELNNKIVTSDQ